MGTGPAPERLKELIETHRQEILERWATERRANPKAARLSEQDLLDHLPRLLTAIAEALPRLPGDSADTEAEASEHALHRLDTGFDLEEVVEEYAILRQVLFQVLRQHRPELIVQGFELLETALDQSVARSVKRFVEVRHRTLEALDRVAETSLLAEDLEALLPRLLNVLVKTAPSVNSAAILLREGEQLRVRAAVGLTGERDTAFVPNGGSPDGAGSAGSSPLSQRIGEGFAGTIAATRQPLFLRSAATGPLSQSELVHEKNLRAIYGVPLMRGHDVLGVACMGSLTAYDFAEEDRLLFRTTADRAAMLIVQAEQRRALKEAGDFRDQVIAIASHDLRNPLQAIVLTTHQLLRRADVPDRIRGLGDRIARSAGRIEAILGGLLDFSETRFRGLLRLQKEGMDLLETTQQAVDELTVAYPNRTVEVAAQGDVKGHWDPQRLAQVVSNLVTNALRYGDPTGPIRVALVGDAEDVRLSVHNPGPPIAADLLPRLFEPFRRGTGADTGKQQGFGLGLYIVDQIARAHGGEVSARSDESGTVFAVRLPR